AAVFPGRPAPADTRKRPVLYLAVRNAWRRVGLTGAPGCCTQMSLDALPRQRSQLHTGLSGSTAAGIKGQGTQVKESAGKPVHDQSGSSLDADGYVVVRTGLPSSILEAVVDDIWRHAGA